MINSPICILPMGLSAVLLSVGGQDKKEGHSSSGDLFDQLDDESHPNGYDGYAGKHSDNSTRLHGAPAVPRSNGQGGQGGEGRAGAGEVAPLPRPNQTLCLKKDESINSGWPPEQGSHVHGVLWRPGRGF
jgi:hypothetical protein